MSTNLTDLSSAAPAGGFIHIREYEAKKSGEIANHTINGNVSWKGTLFRALEALSLVKAEDIARDCDACDGDIDLAKKALAEVKASFQKSYSRLDDGQGTTSNYEYLAPGIATLPNDDTLYIWGLCVHKEVITPGTYKKVASRPKTLVKRYIERLTPASKFRRFKLTPGTYSYVSVNGERV